MRNVAFPCMLMGSIKFAMKQNILIGHLLLSGCKHFFIFIGDYSKQEVERQMLCLLVQILSHHRCRSELSQVN